MTYDKLRYLASATLISLNSLDLSGDYIIDGVSISGGYRGGRRLQGQDSTATMGDMSFPATFANTTYAPNSDLLAINAINVTTNTSTVAIGSTTTNTSTAAIGSTTTNTSIAASNSTNATIAAIANTIAATESSIALSNISPSIKPLPSASLVLSPVLDSSNDSKRIVSDLLTLSDADLIELREAGVDVDSIISINTVGAGTLPASVSSGTFASTTSKPTVASMFDPLPVFTATRTPTAASDTTRTGSPSSSSSSVSFVALVPFNGSDMTSGVVASSVITTVMPISTDASGTSTSIASGVDVLGLALSTAPSVGVIGGASIVTGSTSTNTSKGNGSTAGVSVDPSGRYTTTSKPNNASMTASTTSMGSGISASSASDKIDLFKVSTGAVTSTTTVTPSIKGTIISSVSATSKPGTLAGVSVSSPLPIIPVSTSSPSLDTTSSGMTGDVLSVLFPISSVRSTRPPTSTIVGGTKATSSSSTRKVSVLDNSNHAVSTYDPTISGNSIGSTDLAVSGLPTAMVPDEYPVTSTSTSISSSPPAISSSSRSSSSVADNSTIVGAFLHSSGDPSLIRISRLLVVLIGVLLS